jgi:glycosyltransferase involved in cell wall biosynthesis
MAWAAGVPVVTGRGVEEPEVIHGATGLKVDAADPRAYAFAATRLLGDPELAARMSAAALLELERTRSWDALEQRIAAIAAARLGEEFFGDGSSGRGMLESPWTEQTSPLRRFETT